MVRANFNPFDEHYFVDTEQGVISKLSRRYFTHRRPENFIKSMKGFGISVTELGICWNEGVTNIVILYHGEKINTYYKINIDMLKYFPRYTENGENQIIIPIKEMEVVGESEICVNPM